MLGPAAKFVACSSEPIGGQSDTLLPYLIVHQTITGRSTRISMIADEYLGLEDAALLAQCEVHTYRSSGPGGQHRNKTSSAVRLYHRPTGLAGKGEEDRSQHVNKRRALRRLRLTLATDLLDEVDPDKYAPSVLLAGCITAGRLELRRKDERALPAINEVLSLLQASGGRLREVAGAIGISTANLVKFFHIDPQVWRKVDHVRQAFGLNSLKSPT